MFVLVEACCDGVVYVVCGKLFVMYGSSVFSSVLPSLRELRWVCMLCLCSCFLFGFGIGMMFASFHV